MGAKEQIFSTGTFTKGQPHSVMGDKFKLGPNPKYYFTRSLDVYCIKPEKLTNFQTKFLFQKIVAHLR